MSTWFIKLFSLIMALGLAACSHQPKVELTDEQAKANAYVAPVFYKNQRQYHLDNLHLLKPKAGHELAASQALYQSAIQLMQNKDYQGAQESLLTLTEQVEVTAGILHNLALTAYKLGDVNKSEDWNESALSINKKHPFALNLKGKMLRRKGQFEQAEKAYLSAIEAYPSYAKAKLNLAILYDMYRGEIVKAKRYYQAYLKAFPDDQKVKIWLLNVEQQVAKRVAQSGAVYQSESLEINTQSESLESKSTPKKLSKEQTERLIEGIH